MKLYLEVDLYEGVLFDKKLVDKENVREVLEEVIEGDDKREVIEDLIKNGKGNDEEWRLKGEEVLYIIVEI